MSKIVLNSIETPDGTVLVSRHRHDYKVHTDSVSGETYFVYGGSEYQRTSINGIPAKDLSVYSDAPFEKIRQSYNWGVNTTKDGEVLDETIFKPICDLDTDHIKAILSNGYGGDIAREYMKQELKYREANK